MAMHGSDVADRQLVRPRWYSRARAVISLADYLESNPGATDAIRGKLEPASNDQVLDAFYDWRGTWARSKQLPPDGNWTTWVIRAGRAWGKTLAGSMWVHERALEHPGRWIALVARTPADARDYAVEGPGGILRNVHPRERPLYEPSKRRITWPNRAWATVYSDDEPDQLRGFSGDTAWVDEMAKFVNAEDTWHCLQFGMRERSSDRPRILITTTPRPLPILRQIERLPSTIVVTGSSYENARNLDPRWFDDVLSRYEGTRLGRQEIMAEILEDVPGALWTREILDKCRAELDGALERAPLEIRKSSVEGPAGDGLGSQVVGVCTG
jgi:phage terminase large subunit-like protein